VHADWEMSLSRDLLGEDALPVLIDKAGFFFSPA